MIEAHCLIVEETVPDEEGNVINRSILVNKRDVEAQLQLIEEHYIVNHADGSKATFSKEYTFTHKHDVIASRSSFSLPNIQEITLLSDSYCKDPVFDLKTYAERSFGVYQEEPYKVVWKFTAAVADEVRDHHFHPSQEIQEQPDGSIIVSFIAGGWKEMCWYLMTWEGEAEVLEPASLKKSYADMVENIAKGIKKNGG